MELTHPTRDYVTMFIGGFLRYGLFGVLTLFCFITVCVHAQSLEGRILDLRRGEFIDESTLISNLSRTKVVFIGEKHDNSEHHLIEQKLLATLVDQHTGVVFEILDSRHHSAVDKLYQSGQPKITTAALFELLRWQAVKGWPWTDYGDLFVLAANSGRLIPGNISPEEMGSIYASGLEATTYQLDPALEERLRQPLLELVFDGHCGKLPRPALGPMVDIQLAKDISMAQAIRLDLKQHIFITGSVHARRDIGIPQHLSNAVSPDQSLVVILQQMELDKTSLNQWSDYPNASMNKADYLWFTAPHADRDYCADL